MKDLINWLKNTSGTVFSYSDELYLQGCTLADAYVKNAALRASLKRRVASPVNKKALYIALRRTAELMERMDVSAEKKSETPPLSSLLAKKKTCQKAVKALKMTKKQTPTPPMPAPGSNPTTIPDPNLEG